ncbi:unnamed protein product [marine sediment metagenome]|uniref:SCP2 domain-containing protein n=1 Tax=marine sediment metagenome TaxID=412755 RepID=X1TK73_9ZZZZ
MATIAEKVFDFILEDKLEQQAIIRDLPPDKRDAVVGRKGRLIVTGPEGGSFIVRLTPQGIFRETGTKDLRNEILMSDDTLLEIMIWIAQFPGEPGLTPRAAYVNGDIRISGDSVLYDAEEIFNTLEKHAFSKMGPIARAAVEEMRQRSQG